MDLNARLSTIQAFLGTFREKLKGKKLRTKNSSKISEKLKKVIQNLDILATGIKKISKTKTSPN